MGKEEAAIQTAEVQARKELGEAYELVEVGETVTVERLLRDLGVEDRLDVMIDKCLKRFWRSAGTARRASRSRSVPPIMATSFMTNADYLDDRRYVRANRHPARRARSVILGACDREQRRPPCISR
jgi:hypothetical protein